MAGPLSNDTREMAGISHYQHQLENVCTPYGWSFKPTRSDLRSCLPRPPLQCKIKVNDGILYTSIFTRHLAEFDAEDDLFFSFVSSFN